MDLDVIFLGTSASAPTPRRGLTSVLIRRGGEHILVDCGEGTQRQMMRSCGLVDIDVLLVTHEHGDHILGIPGMLKTLALRERTKPLTVVGPARFRHCFANLARLIGKLPFPLEVMEVGDGWVMRRDGYELSAFATDHSTTSVGYALREYDRPGRFDLEEARRLGVAEGPDFGRLQRGMAVVAADGREVRPEQVLGPARTGRTVVVTGDTRACSAIRSAARDATLLVHEATFSQEEAGRAQHTGHSTAHEAALTALASEVQMLAITHISNRYFGSELTSEAHEVFPNTVCPRDFDLIRVPNIERGDPELVPGGAKEPRISNVVAP